MEPINWHGLTPEQRDRVVAEKVMDWQEKQCDGEWAEVSGGWFCTRCGHDGNWGDSFEHVELPPHYTTSMDAAWLLWPKLLGASYVVRSKFLCAYKEDDDPDKYEWPNYATYEFIELDTVRHVTPERICIAMLRAFGHEVLTK